MHIGERYKALLGQEVTPHGEHLGGGGGGEAVDLLAVLLDLLGVEHALEAAGFLGQLEYPLPLVLRQGRLLGGDPGGVLGLALGLPGGDLSLLAGHLSLVVLVVVKLRVVRLDAIEQQVARLL